MTMRAIVGCFAFACVQICGATDARAQCASQSVGLQEMIWRDGVGAVFLGTVTAVDAGAIGETVTFDVERVWKGSVKKVTKIDRRPSADTGATMFDRGNAYVVFAEPLSSAARAQLQAFGGD